RAGGNRKVRRLRLAKDIRLAGGVDVQRGGVVGLASSEPGRIQDLRTVRTQLGDEGIVGVGRANRSLKTCDIDVASSVQLDGVDAGIRQVCQRCRRSRRRDADR